MPRQFACKKCGVVVDPGELCDCKPMGYYIEVNYIPGEQHVQSRTEVSGQQSP